VDRIHSVDEELNSGTYDWVTQDFNRENYPALGAKLDALPFATTSFTGGVQTEGANQLSELRAHLENARADEASNTPALVLSDGKVRLSGEIRTLATVLSALLANPFMSSKSPNPLSGSACSAGSSNITWNTATLAQATQIEASVTKIENDLIPSLPGQFQEPVQRIVNRHAADALARLVSNAQTTAAYSSLRESSQDSGLRNFDDALPDLARIAQNFTNLHASPEAHCLNRILNRQAESLLDGVNESLGAVYAPVASAANLSDAPLTLAFYGTSTADDLEAYLASERQKVEASANEAEPLIQLLQSAGHHSTSLARWRVISQDVAAFKAKKPGNPIQLLETYIVTELNKVTPEQSCKTTSYHAASDEFLRERSQLSQSAVQACYAETINRYNKIVDSFNGNLAGHFPFSANLDTRAGNEASVEDITAFYRVFDRYSPGLEAVVANAASDPDKAASFLNALAAARPVVSGSAALPAPAIEAQITFRTNRGREHLGNRIAQWTLKIGTQTLDSAQPTSRATPLAWQYGDPVQLTLRYANNSPEQPAPVTPATNPLVDGRSITFNYNDAWSLLSLLQDHPGSANDEPGQHGITIANILPNGSPSGGNGKPDDTLIYFQVELFPAGAKAGAPSLEELQSLLKEQAVRAQLIQVHGVAQ